MRRSVVLLVTIASVAVVAGGCSPVTEGPSSTVARTSLIPDAAIEQAAVRSAAIDFVDAYAAAASDDGATLQDLVEGEVMTTWVHWLGVQNDQLGVDLVGTPSISSVGPARILPAPNGDPGFRVTTLEGRVRFEAPQGTGADLEPFERVLDGDMRLHRQADGRWRVIDFTREGVPLSVSLQIPKKPVRLTAGAGVSVTIDSLFAYPTWQLDLRIAVDDHGPIELVPHGAVLVSGTGGVLASADAVSSSVRAIRSGTAEGLVSFEPLDDVADVSLRLTFDATPRPLVFEFPLEPILSPVIGPASAEGSPSADPATPSPTGAASA
jgi:hypothetical protein